MTPNRVGSAQRFGAGGVSLSTVDCPGCHRTFALDRRGGIPLHRDAHHFNGFNSPTAPVCHGSRLIILE